MSNSSRDQRPLEPEQDGPFSQRRVDRRTFLGVSGAALASLALAGCGGVSQPAAPAAGASPAASGKAQGGKTLNFIMSSDYQPIIEGIAAEYKQQTGTTVNITAQAYNQTHDKIVSGLASGATSYDIVVVDSVWNAEFAAAKFITPLDDRIPKSVQDQLVQAALVSRSFGGKIYQWPLFTMKLLYYNAKMLKDAGFAEPPKTWSELVEMSKTIQSKGIAKYGIAWAMSQAEGLVCDYVLMMNAFGGKYQDAQGNWIVNQGGGLAALQFMADNVQKDKIADPASLTLDDRSNRLGFAAGEIPFLVNWTSAYPQFKDPKSSKVADDVRIGLIPGVKEAGVVSSTCTGASGFGIGANSANKDEAWDFIRSLITTEQAQLRWLKEGNYIPTLKKLYDDPQLAKDYPHLVAMRNQMDYGFGRPDVPWYGEWTKIMQLELNRAFVGDKTPKQALDDAMKQVNALQAANK